VTYTPIAYAHATLHPEARLEVPWRPDFNALVYVLAGSGRVGAELAPIGEGQLAILGAGDHISVSADRQPARPSPTLEILLLGGLPIGEPIAHYGPFVMNTREEILQAVADYQSGRMGRIPPVHGLTADSTP
jgi:hypothetical protein